MAGVPVNEVVGLIGDAGEQTADAGDRPAGAETAVVEETQPEVAAGTEETQPEVAAAVEDTQPDVTAAEETDRPRRFPGLARRRYRKASAAG